MLRVSVIVITYKRTAYLRRSLQCISAQSRAADQVVVVDSSPDEESRPVAEAFPGTTYLHNPDGYGNMPRARNAGLLAATGDILAFIDDDAFAHPEWLEALLAPYGEDDVGGVGGRAINNRPGEETDGIDQIGQIMPDGQVSGFFGANPDGLREVQHLIGCNMSFRRPVLADLGGFREEMSGPVRDDTDISLRVGRRGYRLIFAPTAVVDHLGAPQPFGPRFGLRYDFYTYRNQLILLITHYGLLKPIAWRYLATGSRGAWGRGRSLRGRGARLAAFCLGSVSGVAYGTMLLARGGRDPIRRGTEARRLSAWLRSPG